MFGHNPESALKKTLPYDGEGKKLSE